MTEATNTPSDKQNNKKEQLLEARIGRLLDILSKRDDALNKLKASRDLLQERIYQLKHRVQQRDTAVEKLHIRIIKLLESLEKKQKLFQKAKDRSALYKKRNKKLKNDNSVLRNKNAQLTITVERLQGLLEERDAAVYDLRTRLARELLAQCNTSYDILFVCPNIQCLAHEYGGSFFISRVKAYQSAGYTVLVCEVRQDNITPQLLQTDGVLLLQMDVFTFLSSLSYLDALCAKFAIHDPPPALIDGVLASSSICRITFWLHGSRAIDYRRFTFNYSSEQLEIHRARLDKKNKETMQALHTLYTDDSIKKVFVSSSIKEQSEDDTGTTCLQYAIIHNYIDTQTFSYQKKCPEEAFNVLLIRSFSRRNYATDLAIDAILLLSKSAGFPRMRITLRGTGALFNEQTAKLAHLPNVDAAAVFLGHQKIKALHDQHGIFLAPSRLDSQGVSMCEAMASGLVPITNPVGGITEFVDADCGMLVRPDDPQALAQAILLLQQDHVRFQRLSHAAAARIRRQCSHEQTIQRELALMGFSASSSGTV